MNDDIQRMLQVAGFYVVSADPFLAACLLVEVDAEGVCYQITPSYSRDGVLSADGWGDCVFADGPFVSPQAAFDMVQRIWSEPTIR